MAVVGAVALSPSSCCPRFYSVLCVVVCAARTVWWCGVVVWRGVLCGIAVVCGWRGLCCSLPLVLRVCCHGVRWFRVVSLCQGCVFAEWRC